ncbi:MAG: hypothetical protein COU47_04190 [Candidatus Niyogibacteria bacterium CG10_big_fil_rev_8_21_14_0_10_46_36]|uniref:Uncharacterized protein n=1 Tax=Candidatus Niyogibacteria bacterium CG10_big_fil_rev_8_21_14_0_10_46_36 TaxID=1974726 RepID=A0A2H0TEL6_9BACT|nr:MAG: hypothetical protein COU47_04190 [Candidatus Niyogibacteria bacterium CG10_big_fil_rev_8_21_14_0_10_46_36]
MEQLTEKIKYIPHKLFSILSGSPRGYWGAFVLFAFLFLIFVLVANISIYLDTAHTITPDQVNGIDVHLDKVNEKALDHILFTLSHNELLLEDILEAPAISDPSL